MDRSRWARRLAARPARLALGAAGAVAAVAAATYAVEALSLRAARDVVTVDSRPEPPGSWFRVEADGVRTPPAVAAGAAGLDDSEEVIGVVADGVARAYRLRALADPKRHVLNDVVGGVPVTVAYCDRTGCVRTYTGPGPGPLDVGIGGLRDGGLVVKLGGVFYDHRTGRVVEGPPGASPLASDQIPWARTTWGRWRRDHPATDVSAGPVAASGDPIEPGRPAR